MSAELECALDIAEDGGQAIELLVRIDSDSTMDTPDVVLLDMHLPRADGPAILKYLQTSPRCSGVPVIVMTSADLTASDKQALGPGVKAHFRKPVLLDEFLKLGQVIRRVFESEKLSEI